MESANPAMEFPPAMKTSLQDSEVGNLLTKETPANYFGVFQMLIAFIGMTLCTLLILFVDLSIAIPASLLIYIGIAITEFRRRIYSPVTISLVALYGMLYLLFLLDSPYLPYCGLGIFGWLAVLSVVLLLIKRPMTTFYTDKHGLLSFHYLISNIWLGAFVLSFIAGFVLMPSVWYLVVPFAICFCTCVFVIYLSFFDTKLVTKREKKFSIGAFDFEEIEFSSEAYREYLFFYTNTLIEEVFGRENFPTEEDVARFRSYIGDADAGGKTIFGAYHDGELVGTMSILLSRNDEPFETEELFHCSLDPVRKLGTIATIGRFCIQPKYRETVDIIDGLFKCVAEYALEHDTVFLLGEVLGGKGMAYARLGFSPLFPRSDPRYDKLVIPVIGKIQVMFSNLAQIIFFQKRDSIGSTFNLFKNINELIAERWVKRMVVRHAFSCNEKKPWMHTVASLRYLLGLKPGKVR